MIIWPAKAATEVEDFAFDFTPILQAGEGIASKTVVAVGVTKDSDSISGSLVNVLLSGGTQGTVAKVTCTIVTDGTPQRTYTEVAVLPVDGQIISLDMAKRNQRVTDSDDDDVLASMLRSAIGHVETLTDSYMTQKVVTDEPLNGFSNSNRHRHHPNSLLHPNNVYRANALLLRKGPVSEILSIKYDDVDGVEQTLDPADYRLVENKIVPAHGKNWPVTIAGIGTVRISYIAGYEQTALPPEMIQAALLLFGHYVENREAVVVNNRVAAVELPMGVKALLANYADMP